ncbi:hypothetical protein Mpsy_1545 [Methanolobus psychrophilus R15]|nr:hypothetical protein Mpsy_1545 [Methanolobus psychrophilus R15]
MNFPPTILTENDYLKTLCFISPNTNVKIVSAILNAFLKCIFA